MDKLTTKTSMVLAAIVLLSAEQGYSPTVREIGEAVGLTSSSTVWGHLLRLREKGYIAWEPDKPRTIRVLKAG